jgi:hypothetical protein
MGLRAAADGQLVLACVKNFWLWLVLKGMSVERFSDNWGLIISWRICSGSPYF